MAEATPAQAPVPRLSWLQTLLTHHVAVLALGGALGGAVGPVWQEIKARRAGVAASQLQLAAEQQRLWERNLDCITQGPVWEMDGPEHLVVKVTLCASGDALLRYYQNDAVPQFRWVARPPPPR